MADRRSGRNRGSNRRQASTSRSSQQSRGIPTERDRLNEPDERGGATQDDVARVLRPIVPGMGLALGLADLLGIDDLKPGAGGSVQGPRGDGDERAVRNALLGTPTEAAPATEAGRPGTDVAGLRGRRRRLLDDAEPAAPVRRRRLLAGV